MRMKHLASLVVLAGFASVSATANAADQPAAGGVAGQVTTDFGFDVVIKMSKQAARTLKRKKEGVLVSASYSGTPTKAAEKHADEVGQIDLGNEMITLQGIEGPVHLTGTRVERQRLGWIEGEPRVNVNVFTARRSGPDNLINCDIIDGPVSVVAKGVTTLSCSLITENRDTTSFPR